MSDTLAAAVWALHAARHPLWHARYLHARAFGRIPGRPVDGDPLDPGEARDFVGIVRGLKQDARTERTRT